MNHSTCLRGMRFLLNGVSKISARSSRVWMALLFTWTSTAFAAGEEQQITCPSNEILAAELLEAQIAGARIPGAKKSCLEPDRFRHLKVAELEPGEAVERVQPKFVSEEKPFEIKSVRENEDGLIEVNFIYGLQDGKKLKRVSDTMEFRRYEGFGKTYWGCAAVISPPQHLVIRKSCYNP